MSIGVNSPIGGGQLDQFALPPFPVRRFTVEEYFALIDKGMIGEDDNVELLEGWIVPKMTKKPLHDHTVDRLLRLLSKLLPDHWFLRVQNVLQTSSSAPEPDFAAIRGELDSFRDRHPSGADAGLVIEVAESSLAIDRRKALTYAAAGVPLYWIVNLPERCLEIYDSPQERDGGVRYAEPRIARVEDEVEIILAGVAVGKLRCQQILG